MKIDEAWLDRHNSDPNLAARIEANETAPDPVADWLSAREYYRNEDMPVRLKCHYCGKSPAHRIPTETDPVCARCASVWDRKEQQDDDRQD